MVAIATEAPCETYFGQAENFKDSDGHKTFQFELAAKNV